MLKSVPCAAASPRAASPPPAPATRSSACSAKWFPRFCPEPRRNPEPGPNMAGVFQGAGSWPISTSLTTASWSTVGPCSCPTRREAYISTSRPATLFSSSTQSPSLSSSPSIPTTPSRAPVPSPSMASSQPDMSAELQRTGATQKDSHAGNLYDVARSNRVPGNINNGYTRFAPRQCHLPRNQSVLEGRKRRRANHGNRSAQDSLRRRQRTTHSSWHPHARHLHAASTGFSVQFFPESAILGCGPDAARAYPYTVEASGSGVVVKIAAADRPLSLAFRSDGLLDPGASGPYQVHGRIVTGQNDDGDFTFVPFEQTCSLAVLAPSRRIPSIGRSQCSRHLIRQRWNRRALHPGHAPLGNATLSIVPGLAAQPGAPNPFVSRTPLRPPPHQLRSGACQRRGHRPARYVALHVRSQPLRHPHARLAKRPSTCRSKPPPSPPSAQVQPAEEPCPACLPGPTTS